MEDENNKNLDLKAKIYHLILKNMLKYKYLLSKYIWLDTNNIPNLALKKIYKENIEIWYSNSFKQYNYPILADLIVDYKK